MIGIFPSLGEGEGRWFMFFYCDGSLKRIAVHSVFTEMLNFKLLSARAAGIKHLTFHDVTEITMANNVRIFFNSGQNYTVCVMERR
jgi:hypothetical protein